jgi:Tfp pilus assembly protein PilF
MKRYVVWLAVFLLAAPCVRPQEGPDDEYIRIYNIIQQADAYNQNGQWLRAYQDYETAQAALKKLRTAFPEWDDHLIAFRLDYVAGKLSSLAGKVPKSAPTQPAAQAPAQPQPKTPQEWAQRVQTLQDQLKQARNDRDLLQAKLKEALTAQPAAVDPRLLAAAEEKVKALQKTNDLLQVSLDQARAAKPGQAGSNPETEKALAEAKRKLAEQTQELAALRSKQTAAPGRTAPPATRQMETLRGDNDILQRENQRLAKELADARKEAKASEERLIKLQHGPTPSGPKARGEAQAAARLAEEEVALLRARLAVLEAKNVPYTTEELALFKNQGTNLTPPQTAAGNQTSPPPPASAKLPPEAKTLLAEASRLTDSQRYADAEQDYHRVLKIDTKNVYALANLAAVQLEQGNLTNAETNLNRALALAPNDPFNLYLLGALKYHQGKYDQAFDALSRSVQINPNKPVVQNLLGVVLIQKGLRDQAEIAFRKAIELHPDYAEAHLNLARLYALHQPPLWALAQWHYQKALNAGAKPDPTLEQFFKQHSGAQGTQP